MKDYIFPQSIQSLVLLLIIGLISFNLFTAAWVPLNGDIHYNSDNARDMLLLDDILTNKPIQLIGARSGISGIFHGPLWLYMNLPAYWLGGGNPVTVGWFWFALYVINCGIVFSTTYFFFGLMEGTLSQKVQIEKNVNERRFKTLLAGLVSTLLFSFIFRTTGWSQFNANGVLLIMPIIVVLYAVFAQRMRVAQFSKRTFFTLTALLFTLGLAIQFQIAFGLPLLFLFSLLILWHIIRTKQWTYIFAFGILVVPLSTHILFDIRHNFQHVRALLNLVGIGGVGGGGLGAGGLGAGSGVGGGGSVGFAKLTGILTSLPQRIIFGLTEATSFIPDYSIWTTVVILGSIGYVAIRTYRKDTTGEKSDIDKPKHITLMHFLILYLYLVVGFWVITSPYSGHMWPYYYWGFIPLLCMMIGISVAFISKKYATLTTLALVIMIAIMQAQWFPSAKITSLEPTPISWTFYEKEVGKIFEEAPEEFGYFVFADDLYGYRPKYAFRYHEMLRGKRAVLGEKRPIMYVFFMPTKSVDLTWEGFVQHQVKIGSFEERPADKVTTFENGIAIYTYHLTVDEQTIEPDSTLLKDLMFR